MLIHFIFHLSIQIFILVVIVNLSGVFLHRQDYANVDENQITINLSITKLILKTTLVIELFFLKLIARKCQGNNTFQLTTIFFATCTNSNKTNLSLSELKFD